MRDKFVSEIVFLQKKSLNQGQKGYTPGGWMGGHILAQLKLLDRAECGM